MITLLHDSSFFFQSSGAPRDPHSFPTRRSSDLLYDAGRLGTGAGWHEPAGVEREEAEAVFEELGNGLGLLANRSEEHTSELQSRGHLVCRLLLEKKKKKKKKYKTTPKKNTITIN